VCPDLTTNDWRQCESYLYGIDLFNLGYWWECHEILEGLWHAAGRETATAHALQAVIQCAAAHLKFSGGVPRGAARLLDHSLRHAQWSDDCMLGLDLPQMVADTHAYLTVGDAAPAQLRLKF